MNNLTLDSELLKNKNVLITDDIVDSCETVLEVKELVEKLSDREADSVVLVSKQPLKCHEYKIDFLRGCSRHTWISFPWEHK